MCEKTKNFTRIGRRSNLREWEEEARHENGKKKRTGKYNRKFKFLIYLLI